MTHARFPYQYNFSADRETNEYLQSLTKGTISEFIRLAVTEKVGKLVNTEFKRQLEGEDDNVDRS